MPSSNNTYFECREELLLDLREERSQLPRYADEDDPVTRLLEAPLEEPEWIVVVGPHPAPPRVMIAAFESDARELSHDPGPSTRVKQAVMGLSALIMFGVFLTMFAISSARDNTDQRARARATLLSEAEPHDIDDPPVQQAATRHPDTRERY